MPTRGRQFDKTYRMRWRPKSRERFATGYKRADDATAFLELANKILNPDRQIFLAYDAQQAFQLIQHLGGAAALVDLDLKGKDGLSLTQKLRESFPALPVVAISRVLGVP